MEDKLIKISPATQRVITLLDELYEFGPTVYYQSVSDIEAGRKLFQQVVERVALDQLNLALDRIRALSNKKRITIKPYELKKACELSNDDWLDYQQILQAKRGQYAS
ncbi:MAG: hypothetical protein IBX55_16995 [Methyloprofundus sp.]|nr:hypothetical protein [Methyloprofundus sp.]